MVKDKEFRFLHWFEVRRIPSFRIRGAVFLGVSDKFLKGAPEL